MFASGVDSPLEEIKQSDFGSKIDQINHFRVLAQDFADQIVTLDADFTSKRVLTEAIREVLAVETPRFLLRVEGQPDIF
jgi:hypothetical protein